MRQSCSICNKDLEACSAKCQLICACHRAHGSCESLCESVGEARVPKTPQHGLLQLIESARRDLPISAFRNQMFLASWSSLVHIQWMNSREAIFSALFGRRKMRVGSEWTPSARSRIFPPRPANKWNSTAVGFRKKRRTPYPAQEGEFCGWRRSAQP